MKLITDPLIAVWTFAKRRSDADIVCARINSLSHLQCLALGNSECYESTVVPPCLVIVDTDNDASFARATVEHVRTRRVTAETPILLLIDRELFFADCGLVDQQNIDFVSSSIDGIEFALRARNLIALGHSQLELNSRGALLKNAIENATEELKTREAETLLLLSRAAEYRDPDTGGHVKRMAAYSELLARKLSELHPYDPRDVMLAAPMHDLGKIAMPDSVLLNSEGFTDEEWALMKQHARIGYDVLRDSESHVLRMAAIIALSHHEAWDGNGYPDGKRGEEIPILGRIVAVADVFDALTSERPYKDAWTLDQAFDELKRLSGKKLDPTIVQAFLDSRAEVESIRARYGDAIKSHARVLEHA